MINISQRLLTQPELRRKYRGIPFYSLNGRGLARLEARYGIAEVLRFTVKRSWRLSHYEGPPEVPNSWLLDAGDDDYFFISTWTHLHARDGEFPGTKVSVERLPFTKRVLNATAEGPAVAGKFILGNAQADLVTSRLVECDIIAKASMPRSILKILDK